MPPPEKSVRGNDASSVVTKSDTETVKKHVTNASQTDDEQQQLSQQPQHQSSTQPHNRSAEAAGVVRGVSRSVGRSLARMRVAGKVGTKLPSQTLSKIKIPKTKMPFQLPKFKFKLPKRPSGIKMVSKELPTGRVAKISDRLNTGWEWWSLAVESNGADESGGNANDEKKDNNNGNSKTDASTNNSKTNNQQPPAQTQQQQPPPTKPTTRDWVAIAHRAKHFAIGE